MEDFAALVIISFDWNVHYLEWTGQSKSWFTESKYIHLYAAKKEQKLLAEATARRLEVYEVDTWTLVRIITAFLNVAVRCFYQALSLRNCNIKQVRFADLIEFLCSVLCCMVPQSSISVEESQAAIWMVYQL